jgi:hypothetical protein
VEIWEFLEGTLLATMRSGMGVRFALMLALAFGVWGQSPSANTDSTQAAPARNEAVAQAPAGQNAAQDPAGPNKDAVPAPSPAQNHAETKKHAHTPVAEQHNHTTAEMLVAEVKDLPIQIGGQPLEHWIRMYLIVTGGFVFVGVIALGMMWRQLREMRLAREQGDKLGRRANEQLGALREAAERTDELIQQMTEQARIAGEQTKAATMAACAAKTSSETFAQIASSSVHHVQFAEEAMRLQQRAWVFVTDLRAGELQAGKPVSMTLGFKNTGRTPARNVQIASQIDALPKGHAPQPKLDKGYSRGIIPPEGTVFVSIGNGRSSGEGLTQQELQAISSGDLVVWVYGTLTYDDVFEVRQATIFCYRLQPDGRTFAVAEIYNEAT